MRNIIYKLIVTINFITGLAFASSCENQERSVTIYDENSFGTGGEIYYKRWCWTDKVVTSGLSGNVLPMLYLVSVDGENWTQPSPPDNGCTYQAPNSMAVIQLATGISGDIFQFFFGPRKIVYNSAPTFALEDPFSFPYAMYFDIGGELIGLAYSTNGIFWSRFGDNPVALPSEPPPISIPSEPVINDIPSEPVVIIPQEPEPVIAKENIIIVAEPKIEEPIVFVTPGPALPLPPEALTVRQIQNRFLFKTEIVHEIIWKPSPSPSVRGYKVYCDDQLIASVPARVLSFQDRKHNGIGFEYTVTALDENGESEPKGLKK